MAIFRARVPSRIDFLGGGSDAPPFSAEHGGAVINAAISRYTNCTVEVGAHLTGVELNSLDFGMSVRAGEVGELAFDGKLDLIKAVIRRSGIQGPLRVTTEIDLPPTSGLGASGTLSVGIAAACLRAQGKPVEQKEVLRIAFLAERVDLGMTGGIQDACGGTYGSLRCYDFGDPPTAEVRNIALTADQTAEIQHRLVLVYTGQTHLSHNIHDDIKTAYANDDSPCKRAMFSLARLAREGVKVLERGELDTFGEMLNENWKLHKDLHASCTNERLEEIYALAKPYAIGGKTCGAGGGGCVVFYCADGKQRELRQKLEACGCETLHFTFDHEGVRTWEAGVRD